MGQLTWKGAAREVGRTALRHKVLSAVIGDGRLPRDRCVGHGALGGRIAVTGDQFGLGVRDVQRTGHDDEKEHREREG
jgi:hypothetical protein